MYSSILFIHVLAGLLLVGGSFFAPLVRRAVLGAASLGELRTWLGFAQRTTRANPAFALVLLASGIYLGSQGWWTAGWFYVALFAWFVNLHLAALVVQRSAKRVAEAAAAGDGAIGEEVDRLRRRKAWDVAEESLLANDVAILFAMVNKPSLLVTIGVLVTANVVLIAIGEVRRRNAQLEVAEG